MPRWNKSRVFPAVLAGVGLVAFTTTALNSKSIDASAYEAMPYDELISSIASISSLSTENVSESLGTKNLLVVTDDVSEIENLSGNTRHIYKNLYSVNFENEKDTAVAYSVLKKNPKTAVSLDAKTEITGIGNPNNIAWGTSATYLNEYSDKAAMSCGNGNINVAVADTGIYKDHESFTDKSQYDRLRLDMARNYYGHENDATFDTTEYRDKKGHGTSVASIIAQSTPSCVKIVPIRVMGDDGTGSIATWLYYLADIYDNNLPVNVVNLSLGIEAGKLELTQELADIVNDIFSTLRERGIAIVAAAGNDGEEGVMFPGNVKDAIAVSAINRSKQLSLFSNYGNKIEFSAPGESLVLAGLGGPTDYNDEIDGRGTSFAAPYVAAAFANERLLHPTYSVDAMTRDLALNSEDLGAKGRDNQYGYGSINFSKSEFSPLAIELASNTGGLTFNITSDSVIDKIAITNDTTFLPSDSQWFAPEQSNSTSVSYTYHPTSTGIFLIWAHTTAGETKVNAYNVTELVPEQPSDNDQTNKAPVISSFTVDSSQPNKATFKANVSDPDGYVKTINWCITANGNGTKSCRTSSYTANDSNEKSYTMTLNPGTYTGQIEVIDDKGSAKTSGFAIFTVSGEPTNNQPDDDEGNEGNDAEEDSDNTNDSNGNQATPQPDQTPDNTDKTPIEETTPSDPTVQRPNTLKPAETINNPNTADVSAKTILYSISSLTLAASTILFIKRR